MESQNEVENENENEEQEQEEIKPSELPNPISDLDFGSLERRDPSFQMGGYVLVYEKDVPFELKLETDTETKDLAQMEQIHCKVLLPRMNNKKGSEEPETEIIRTELSSENDLFFHYTSDIDPEIFEMICMKQNLSIEYENLCETLQRLFDDCVNEPETYIAVFIMNKNGMGNLTFVKNSEYRIDELLSFNFVMSSNDTLRKQIGYRYLCLKSKIEYLEDISNEVAHVIRRKNPDIAQKVLDEEKEMNKNIMEGIFNKNFMLPEMIKVKAEIKESEESEDIKSIKIKKKKKNVKSKYKDNIKVDDVDLDEEEEYIKNINTKRGVKNYKGKGNEK